MKKYIYCITLADAYRAINRENVIQAAKGEFYNITAPNLDGLKPSMDFVKGIVDENEIVEIYYSQVDVWDKTTISLSLEGMGTKEKPYLIQSGADLAYLKNETNFGNEFTGKYFKLTKSIDVNESNFMMGKFSGHFDGNNCSIRGLNIVNTTETKVMAVPIDLLTDIVINIMHTKASITVCPASIFAKRRIVKANGFTNTPNNSINGIIGTGSLSHTGTSGQNISL